MSRRRAVAAVLAGVLGVGVVVAVPSLVAGQRSDAPVPWRDQPGATYAAPPQPGCSNAGTEATLGRTGVWHGQVTQEIVLRNRGSRPCALAAPAVRLASTHARTGWVPAARGRFATQGLTLAPDGGAIVLVGVRGNCTDPGPAAGRLALDVGVGTARTLPGVRLGLGCGAPTIAGFQATDDGGPASDPRSSLLARWTGPRTAVAGHPLRYVIRLVNPTSHRVELGQSSTEPCPSYTQLAGGIGADRPLRLNCGGAAAVPAHGSLRFAMRMEVPPAASGAVKVGWHLEVADGATTGSTIEVRRPR